MNNIKTDYSNPDNLYYYLVNDSEVQLNVDIIKQKTISTNFGSIELAIIGSSHYMKLDNTFTELLSCTHEDIKDNLLIVKRSNDVINFSHQFDNLTYVTNIITERKKTESEFIQAEQLLYNQDNDLKHFFCKNTALTSLKTAIYEGKCIVETWHTYPEHLKIVYSSTEIAMPDNKNSIGC